MDDSDGLDAEKVTAVTWATARRLGGLHIEQTYPQRGICRWCLKRWPCPDRRWVDRIEASVEHLGLADPEK